MSKIGKLRLALLEVYREHKRDDTLPTNGQFLWYELVSRKVVSKEWKGSGRKPKQDVVDALMDLRESGDIPWDDIKDETRSISNYRGNPSIREGLLESLPYYQLDAWAGDPPLILTESRSLRGVLDDLAREYTVPITSTNGQCGGFLRTRIAPFISDLSRSRRILYLGDLDLSGGHIEDNTERVLEREIGTLAWERLAITREQVDRHDLEWVWKTDNRYKPIYRYKAVETEALSQKIIFEILRDRLEELLPEPLNRVQVRASQQRAVIQKALHKLNGGLRK
jgi:hypothetical protein